MKKLLLVDDEQCTTVSLEKIIDQHCKDFSVVGQAINSKEALAFIHVHPVDIVVMDIRMPVMDGIVFLRELKKETNAPKVIILSAYRDFEYARQALRYGACGYLLKPVSTDKLFVELNYASSLVERDRDARQAHAVVQLVTQQKAVRRLVKKGIISEDLPLALLLPVCGRLVLARCEAEIPQPFLDDCQLLGWNSYDDHTLLCFLPDERPNAQQYLHQKAEELRAASVEYYLPDIVVACSKQGHTTATLPVAYSECEIAEEYYFYLASKTVISIEDIHPISTQDNRAAIDQFAQLNERIKLGKVEPVLEKLHEMYHTIRQSMSLPPQTAVQLCYELLLNMEKYFCKTKLSSSAADTLATITPQKVFSCKTFGSLYTCLTFQMQQFIGQAEMLPAENDDRIVEKAKQYCQQNYNKGCSLEEIAANVHISKNYLSLQFKKSTGVSIWNYLTDVRIERAKVLLALEEARAVQVGEQVGYKNPSHFGKIFKSRVGISPKEYQLRMLEQTEYTWQNTRKMF